MIISIKIAKIFSRDYHTFSAMDKKNPISVGIFGCGARIRGIVKRCMERDAGVRIAAVHDPSDANVEMLREATGGDITKSVSEKELLEKDGLDWVWIGSPNSEHARQAMSALCADKHVFCEKPLATTVEDCIAIRDVVREKGRKFVFGLVLRHSPYYRAVKRILESGLIGPLVSFEFNEHLSAAHGGYIMGNWRRTQQASGGHLLEKCCHDFDIANWLCDSLPVRAASFGGHKVFRPENRDHLRALGGITARGRPLHDSWRDGVRQDAFGTGIDIIDHQVAILEYANGVTASFHTNIHSGLPERRLMLIGRDGALSGDLRTGEFTVRRIGEQEPRALHSFDSAGGHGGGDGFQCNNLVAVMRGEATPLAGVDEGIHSAIACLGVERARESGTVTDLRPLWQEAQIDLAPSH